MKKEEYSKGDYVKMLSGTYAGTFAYMITTNSSEAALAMVNGTIGWYRYESFELVHKSKLTKFEPKVGDRVKVAYNIGELKAGDIVYYKQASGGLCCHYIGSADETNSYRWNNVYIVLPLTSIREGSGKVSALSLLGKPQKALR